MAIIAKSKNMTEGRFTQPPPDEEPKPDPPKRQPLLQPKLPPSFDCEAFTNDVELPPWLQTTRTQQPAASPGTPGTPGISPSVKFVLPQKKPPRKKRRRNATLYDAVAGRVGPHGFHKKPAASKHRDTASTGQRTLPPEEVLIRRPHYLNNKLKGVPYFANERLPREAKLPTSEMLASIHAYAADFFKYGMERFRPVYQSMDESALLAFGILAEELSKEGMGSTGWKRLLDDPQATDNEDVDNPIPDRLRTRKRRSEMVFDPNYRIVIREGRARFIRKRKPRTKSTDPAKKKPARRRRPIPYIYTEEGRREAARLVAHHEQLDREVAERKERERKERKEKRRREKEKEREKKK